MMKHPIPKSKISQFPGRIKPQNVFKINQMYAQPDIAISKTYSKIT